ncbi:MAG: hypothetical protein MRY83_08760 [Flavobacteriales bacterium]|nr:hypothetical protein [Flavobacteriales bacterium]
MKHTFLLYLSFGIFAAHAQFINPIVGDTSWIEHSGHLPSGKENEQQRIATHLQFILAKLKSKNIQDSQRIENLDHLEAYIELARFPKNTKYEYSRKPCFIDDEGTICAVGYLIQETAGRALAESINSKYQYDLLSNIKDPELMQWQKESGLSLVELASIQPTYEYENNPTIDQDAVLDGLIEPINYWIGDESWYQKFGRAPNHNDGETDRILTHLQYVLEVLQSKDIQDSQRIENLNHLEDYIKQAKFPKNTQYPYSRRPCFIDDEGTICAVGYLIQETAGRGLAESINSKYQYEFLTNMNDSALLEWQKCSGLSLVELAMIQPAYNYNIYIPPPTHSHEDMAAIIKHQSRSVQYIGLRRNFEVYLGLVDYQFMNQYKEQILSTIGCQIDFPLFKKFHVGGNFTFFQKDQQGKPSTSEEVTALKFSMTPTLYWYIMNSKHFQLAPYTGVGLQVRNYHLDLFWMADESTIGNIQQGIDARAGVLVRYFPIQKLGISMNVGIGGPIASLGLVFRN